jgi:hypothetical protein
MIGPVQVCESCGKPKIVLTVIELPGAEPFKVCNGCAPSSRAVA